MIIDSPIISGSSAASGSLNQFGNIAITGSLTVTGAIIGAVTGSVNSASYASNAELLDGRDSTTFTSTSSFQNYTSSNDAQVLQLNNVSASLNSYTSSNNANIAALNAATASLYNATSSIYLATASLNLATASIYASTASLNLATASIYGATSSLFAYTASNSANIANLFATSASLNAAVADIRNATASLYAATASLYNATASIYGATSSLFNYSASSNLRINALDQYTASLNIRSASFACIDSTNNFACAQYFSNASNAVSFTSTGSLYSDGGVRITKDMYVSGTAFFNNVTVFGTQSVNYITSSQLNISSNIISVNTATPTVRFGGLAVYDSGSLGTGLTGSLLWDSEDNQWIYSNPSGSTYDSALFLVGPRNSGALGGEAGITCNFLSKGNGMHHMTSSGIFEDGSKTCFYGSSYVTSSGGAYFSGSVGIGLENPIAKLEASKFQGHGLRINYCTDQSVTAGDGCQGGIYVVNCGLNGYPLVVDEISTNAAGGQYPVLIRSLATGGTPAIGMATGIHFGVPDCASNINVAQMAFRTTDANPSTYTMRWEMRMKNLNTYQTNFMVLGDGSLALGTNGTAPSYRLDVSGCARITGDACIGGMTLINSCLGIGCATPGASLDINSGAALSLNVNSSQNTYLRFQKSGTSFGDIGNAESLATGGNACDLAVHTRSTGNIVFATNFTERARITNAGIACFSNTICAPTVLSSGTICSAGNATIAGCLGIGTNSPSSYCHGGSNRVAEIFNSDTSANSQSHLILSTGASTIPGAIGSVTWVVPNSSAANKMGSYIGADIEANSSTAVCTNIFLATRNNETTPQLRLRVFANGVACFSCQVCVGGMVALTNTSFGTPATEAAYRIRMYDNGGINNDPGIGLDGAGGGGERMWFNALGGFYMNLGTGGSKFSMDSGGTSCFGSTVCIPRLEILRSGVNNGLFIYSNAGATAIGCTMVQINGLTNDSTGNILTLGSLNDGIRMVVRNDGNVGIGTSSPISKLDVRGVLSVGGATNTYPVIQRSTTPAGSQGIILTAGTGKSESGSGITFADNADSGGTIWLSGNSNDIYGGGAYIYAYGQTASANVIGFHTRSGAGTTAERARITSDGLFYINPSTPAIPAQLTIKATATDGNQIYIIQSNDDRGWRFRAQTNGHFYLQSSYTGADTTRFMITYDTGNICVGGSIIPLANGTQDLGSSSFRWCTVYTSDLSLNNGIGNYTIVEGENDLFLYNNNSCKVFKFLLQEVCPEIAPAKRSI